MNSHARDEYLETEVMTATPQKLQLMLIEAAIRFSGRAMNLLPLGKLAEAGELLIRAQEAVCEILSGIRHEANPELASRVSAIYNFIYRKLIEAHLSHDPAPIRDALRVLGEERATWLAVCEQLGTRMNSSPSVPAATQQIPAPHTPLHGAVQLASERLSFEA